MELRRHNVVLRDGPIVLRPMCERDWPDLLRWNRNPDVLRFVEGDPKARYDLASVQVQYRAISRSAHCFVIKYGRAIGWCWLQQMNLSRILERFPDAIAAGSTSRSASLACGAGVSARRRSGS